MIFEQEYNERQRLEKLVTDLTGWSVSGAGCGMGCFDLTLDLPDGTSLQIDGSIGTRELEFTRFSTEQGILNLDLDLGPYEEQAKKIEAAFYPPANA